MVYGATRFCERRTVSSWQSVCNELRWIQESDVPAFQFALWLADIFNAENDTLYSVVAPRWMFRRFYNGPEIRLRRQLLAVY